MTRRLSVLFVLCLLLGAGHAMAPSVATAQPQDREVLDGIAAVVADEIILRSEVDQAARQMARQQRQSDYTRDMWMRALDQLINQQVLAEQARQDTTITISDEQVDSQLDARIQQLVSRAGSEEKVEQQYGKSIVELKQQFRADFRDQLLAQRMQATKLQSIEITPSEVRSWFEEIPQDSLPRLPNTVRLSHIVRYPKPSPDAKARAQDIITTIRDSIVNSNVTIEEMARQFSDDQNTASSGGLIQDVNIDDLVPEFAAIASRAPIGEISQVFYNPQQRGYHILRVNSRSGGVIDLNHVLIRASAAAGPPERTIDYLNAVRDTLKNYEVPFGLMAKRHSEEERSAQNSGRVTDPSTGTRDLVLDRLGPSWRATVDTLKEGEISKPAEVNLLDGETAYHIVKLQKRTPAHRVSLETDYDRIRQYALQDKRQRIREQWISRLREDTYIDVRVEKTDLTAGRQ